MKHRAQFRWFILILLFLATTILYIDRSALGILAPDLQKSIGWSEEQYGYINTAFMIAYAICFLVMGSIIDRIGTRKGYVLSIGIWSLATAAHALAGRWIGFAIARFSLAVGQSGNFPSAIKAVAEWFPKKERALAVGIFNGGANMGTILAPLIIPGLVLMAGTWRVAFLWTLPISLLWIVLWLFSYRRPEQHRRVSKEELAYINSDSEENEKRERLPWKAILPHRGTWAIAIAKFMADPIWWFYLFWGAKFLNEKFGVNLKEIGLPFFTIYLVSWGMGVLLGGFSSRLLKKGLSLNRGQEAGDAGLWHLRHSGYLCAPYGFPLAGCGTDLTGCRRALWMVCQCIQSDVRYFSQKGHCLSCRIRRVLRSSRRGHCGLWGWQDFTKHWHRWLCHSLPGGWSGIPCGIGGHSADRAKDRTLKTIEQK